MKTYTNIVHKFVGKDGNTYINTTTRLNQHGSRWYTTLRVPAGIEVTEGQQIDDEIIESWELMASTDSPHKKPLKAFKKSVTS